MASMKPVSRRELIRRLRELGFDGPFSGGHHEFMLRGTHRLIIPNPHRKEIGSDLLLRILKQAGVNREEWESIGK
jgi:predicted RNA binding protein YcfA (HicA-like mRNA interferase family)